MVSPWFIYLAISQEMRGLSDTLEGFKSHPIREIIEQTIGRRARYRDAEIGWQNATKAIVRVYLHGSRIDISPVKRVTAFEGMKEGKKKKLSEFTAKSRKNLLKLIHSLSFKKLEFLPLFITLTYPSVWPESPATWKRHLDLIGQWLVYTHPECSFIWKLEPQERGAPHFHLMVFGLRFIHHSIIARRWFEIVDSGDSNHLKAGTEVRKVHSVRQAANYASKRYMGKECGSFGQDVGRFWGIIGRKKLPVSDFQEVEIEADTVNRIRRVYRKRMQKLGYRRGCSDFGAFTIFTNSIETWLTVCEWAIDVGPWVQLQRGIPF